MKSEQWILNRFEIVINLIDTIHTRIGLKSELIHFLGFHQIELMFWAQYITNNNNQIFFYW